MITTCLFYSLEKQKSDITKALVEYYSKKKQSKSYLDLSQKVCSDTTGVCSRLTEDGKPTVSICIIFFLNINECTNKVNG